MADSSGRFQATAWNDTPWAVAWGVQLVATLAASVFAIIHLLKHPKNVSTHASEPPPVGLKHGWLWLLLGILMAIANAMIVLVLLRKFPRQFIYTCNVVYICLIFALAVLSFLAGSIIGGIFLVIIAALYIWWLKSVKDRIAFASLILASATSISAKYPAMTVLTVGGFFVTGIYAVLFFFLVVLAQAIPGIWVLLVLFFYWTSEVFQNVVYTTCCGVAATWYFMRNQVANPTLGAFRRSVTSSLGSICLGSLLVAILKTIRLLLRMMIDQLAGEGGCGAFAAFIICCVEALLHMVEDWLQYFNEYAYSQIAIYGKKYTAAAKDTLRLLEQCGLLAIINDMLINPVFMITSIFSGLIVGFVVGILARNAEFGVFGFLVGLYMCAMCLGTVRACVVTLFVCYAEQPQALQVNDPELYQALQAANGSAPPSPLEVVTQSPIPVQPAAPYGVPVAPPPAVPSNDTAQCVTAPSCAYNQPYYAQGVPQGPSYGGQPSSHEHPLPPYGQSPAPHGSHPTSYDPRPTSYNQHSPTYGPYPTSYDQPTAPPISHSNPIPAQSQVHTGQSPPDVDVITGADGMLCVGVRVKVQHAKILEGGPKQGEAGPDGWCHGTVEMIQAGDGLVGIKFDNGSGGMAYAHAVFML